MADPLSIFVGAVGLAGAVGHVYKSMKTYKKDYKEAETQIHHAQIQKSMVQSHLASDIIITDSEFTAAQASFHTIEKGLSQIPSNPCEKMSKRTRAGWAVHGKDITDKNISQLKDIEISTILEVSLNAHAQAQAYRQKQELRDAQLNSTNIQILQNLELIASIASSLKSCTPTNHTSQASLSSITLPWYNVFASTILLLTYKSNGHTKNDIRLQAFLPWSKILNFRVAYSWPTWLALSCSALLRIQNIISAESPIVQACMEGNIEAMRALFASVQCHPNDTVVGQHSLLNLAIRAGKINAVNLLLQLGADPNVTSGRWETSPLDSAFTYGQVEVAQALLNKRADIHYINKRMWTAARHMFEPQITRTCSIELLQICEDEGLDDWNEKDAKGWTILHRAAAFGRGKDIRKLLHLGASSLIATYAMKWLPIFCAVEYGNESTFDALVEEIPPWSLPGLTDVRGWTLLHLAAQHGSRNLITKLLQRGVRTDRRSIAHTKRLPDELRFRELVPEDIAKAFQRNDVYQKCLHLASTTSA
ncbi:ankyrin repeat-containing domain protein [Bisporella sp. PMI_857]|nr:ankyrin repeat-containing domain protein [Bisporella sp. PMI_857]